MYPDLVTIGNFTITSFGVMMFLAFLTAAWTMTIQLRRRGYNPELAWDMLLWVALGGILGAKLYYMILHLDATLADPTGALLSRAGLVWYGGLIGGALAFWWQVRKRDLPLGHMFDAVGPGLMLAYAVGRLGCFLVGDDYGVPTESWVGVAFPEGAPPTTAANLRAMGADVPAAVPDWEVLAVHPTQLYEVGAALILFGVLWKLSGRALAAGQLFAAYLGLYGIERFLIEFVRIKDDRFLLGLSTSQILSALLIVLGVALWQRLGARRAASRGSAASPEAPAGSAARAARP